MMKHFLILCALLVACDAAPEISTAPSQSLDAPPTAIPAPAVHPSPFKSGTGGEGLPPPPPPRAPLLAALNKTQAAQKYFVTMTLRVTQGNAPAFSQTLQGAVSGNDSRYTFLFANESVELITVNGQHFVKGARSLGAPNISKWYAITPDLADAVRFPFAPAEMLAALAATGLTQNFQITAREIFDGINCPLWSYAPKSLGEIGIGNVLGLDAPENAFAVVDRAEIKLSACDDALLQIRVDVAARKATNPAEKGTLNLVIAFSDLNRADIRIAPPANAEPFQLGAPKP